MKNARLFELVVAILMIIGGINWGLVGLFQWDLIASIFGEMSGITRFIYVIIGLAGVYRILVWMKGKSK